ncbi:hypothetical protein Y1Q_0022032 [Alligator mississippiensis]|uniref:Uncharacterized protein n=1 Tax=Alligator mississippiensis TaxID=8496 RepID=A0A151NLP9_ALLMI|nr:hypothetical protein Y1Q_0022032 [Alligator mississippiensis]
MMGPRGVRKEESAPPRLEDVFWRDVYIVQAVFYVYSWPNAVMAFIVTSDVVYFGLVKNTQFFLYTGCLLHSSLLKGSL